MTLYRMYTASKPKTNRFLLEYRTYNCDPDPPAIRVGIATWGDNFPTISAKMSAVKRNTN